MDDGALFRNPAIAAYPVNRLLRRILISFLLFFTAWLAGLGWFISQIPMQPAPADLHTDAIVVLTGGSGRVEYGLQLLAEGTSDKLFISGVHDNTSTETLIHRAPDAIQPILATKSITIGHQAENTIGNAEETKNWLAKENLHSIRLITTNYHMPRSLGEFQQIAGNITIVPTPVFTEEFFLSHILTDRETRIRLFSEYHKFLASKLRHWLVSVLRKPSSPSPLEGEGGVGGKPHTPSPVSAPPLTPPSRGGE